MSVTSGFFNSLNHDRRYTAEQFSSLFNGIINDGVFMSIGTAFGVRVESASTITVGAGRAWFNSVWIDNDAPLPITLDKSEVLLDRYDAVIFNVDHSDPVRDGNIKIVKGVPSKNPERPKMISTKNVHQYPIAYILRKAGSTSISQADISSMIGFDDCPYITGILQVLNIDNIVAQWQAQWLQWYNTQTTNGANQINSWISDKQTEFNEWFNGLKTFIDGDIATKLSNDVLELQAKFDILSKDHSIYQNIVDSSDNLIEDSYGTFVEGTVVFGESSVCILSGESSGVVNTQSKTATPKTVSQTIFPDSGVDYLTDVRINAVPYIESDNQSGGKTARIIE